MLAASAAPGTASRRANLKRIPHAPAPSGAPCAHRRIRCQRDPIGRQARPARWQVVKAYISRILRLALLGAGYSGNYPRGEAGSAADAVPPGAAAAGELGGAAPARTQRIPALKQGRAFARCPAGLAAAIPPKHGLKRPRPSEIHLLFLSLRSRPAGLRFTGRCSTRCRPSSSCRPWAS